MLSNIIKINWMEKTVKSNKKTLYKSLKKYFNNTKSKLLQPRKTYDINLDKTPYKTKLPKIVTILIKTVNQNEHFKKVLFNYVLKWYTLEQYRKSHYRIKWIKDKTEKKWFKYTKEYIDKELWHKLPINDIREMINVHIRKNKEVRDIINYDVNKIWKETRTLAFLLNNTKYMEKDIKVSSVEDIERLAKSDKIIVRDVLAWRIKPVTTESATKLLDINIELIIKWKNLINKNIWKLDLEKYSDLKALSDIIDTAFKQNRLLEGKSTENIAVWIADIYDTIIQNADNKKEVE
jgi:hypothetical protein